MELPFALREGSPDAALQTFSARQIAALIRALDSRLLGIDYDASGPKPVLVYTFELAGAIKQFALAAPPHSLISIADMYAEATAYECEIERRYHLTFRSQPQRPE